MNTWQDLRQLQYLIRNRNWTGSSNPVFHEGSVLVTAAAREEVVEKLIAPFCIISPAGATADEEEPDLITQDVRITLATIHAGDAYGEYPLLGGQRDGQTESNGRGLLEIEEELFAAVELLNTDDGLVIQHIASSATIPEYVSGRYLLFRDYLFRVHATADRYYHPAIHFAGSAA